MCPIKNTKLVHLLGQGGNVEVTPSTVVSRSWNTFEFKLTLGVGGLAVEDSLGLVCGANIDRWQFQFASHIWGVYTPWQAHDPAAPNFIAVACSRANATPRIRIGSSGGLKLFANRADHFVRSLRNRFRYVLEIISDNPLRKGDTLSITWGDTTWGSPGVQAPCLAFRQFFLPFKYSLLPRYDRDLPIRRGEFEALPSIRVTGGAATRLHCAIQPLAGRGEKLRLHCAAIDNYGNLDENFTGYTSIHSSDKTGQIPAKLRFTRNHKGWRVVKGLQFHKAGWQCIELHSDAIKSLPHPVLVSETPPENRIYFGGMHGHTLDCDGTFPASEHYNYARDVAGLDFCSTASHAEYFGTKTAWTNYLQTATRAREPGRFETFYGYEWAGEGHVNAYFLNERDVVNIYGKRILRGHHPEDEPAFRTSCNREPLFLQKTGSLKCPILCIAHFHTAYVPPVNNSALRLHEVYSMHQENPREEKLRYVLSCGIRVGVVGGSDSHRLPIGSLCPNPDALWHQPLEIAGKTGSQSVQKKCGLQATFAPALGRKALFDGMHNRFTYGTTGARIVLIFEINDVHMGQILRAELDETLLLKARIGCSSRIREVCVMQYNGKEWSELIRRCNPGTNTLDISHQFRCGKKGGIYFLRVTQTDGEQGWSSPIWITHDESNQL